MPNRSHLGLIGRHRTAGSLAALELAVRRELLLAGDEVLLDLLLQRERATPSRHARVNQCIDRRQNNGTTSPHSPWRPWACYCTPRAAGSRAPSGGRAAVSSHTRPSIINRLFTSVLRKSSTTDNVEQNRLIESFVDSLNSWLSTYFWRIEEISSPKTGIGLLLIHDTQSVIRSHRYFSTSPFDEHSRQILEWDW